MSFPGTTCDLPLILFNGSSFRIRFEKYENCYGGSVIIINFTNNHHGPIEIANKKCLLENQNHKENSPRSGAHG